MREADGDRDEHGRRPQPAEQLNRRHGPAVKAVEPPLIAVVHGERGGVRQHPLADARMNERQRREKEPEKHHEWIGGNQQGIGQQARNAAGAKDVDNVFRIFAACHTFAGCDDRDGAA